MNMRNATCVGTKTSKIPTRVTLLFIFYSVIVMNFAGHEFHATPVNNVYFFSVQCFIKIDTKFQGWKLDLRLVVSATLF